MKEIEVFYIRLAILLISLYLLGVLIFAYFDRDLSKLNYILGHSLIMDSYLLICCLNNKRYHCRYMRFLCYNLIYVDITATLNKYYYIFKDFNTVFILYSSTWFITTIITIFLAIKHFSKLLKLNK